MSALFYFNNPTCAYTISYTLTENSWLTVGENTSCFSYYCDPFNVMRIIAAAEILSTYMYKNILHIYIQSPTCTSHNSMHTPSSIAIGIGMWIAPCTAFCHCSLQINIPSDLVQYILDCVSQGQITRGLFHEAALNIFSILIHYWKR